MQNNNQKIEFEIPGDVSIVRPINDILRKYGLKKDYDWLNQSEGKESQVAIIEDAALVIAQKEIPEEKLVEFLQKHLETSQETAEKIVRDIKLKIIPFAKTVDLSKEEVLPPGVKKVEVTNVEENAKAIQKEKKFNEENKSKIIEESSNKEKLKEDKLTTEKKGRDTYREPIE